MKKFLIVVICLLTVTTTQADLLDQIIKLIEDYKQSKEILVSDTKYIVSSVDSLQNQYLNDSTIVVKTFKKIIQ